MIGQHQYFGTFSPDSYIYVPTDNDGFSIDELDAAYNWYLEKHDRRSEHFGRFFS